MRHIPLSRFPYVIYYVVERDGVSVLAVIHGRRHPHRWQNRR
jgi:plasmid stabilization system protein ParE